MAVSSSAAPPSAPDITSVTIEEEMRRSYLDYAMSVIVARALPDVRDGLKPVHRRILYSMKVNGNEWNRGYRKSARIVGDVIGKYHPHGELAIYDAMVRMAQDFAMRLTLIDGQGNFGSMDGDSPAAYRYTEARLARVADALLDDLDKETVDFQPNYDETEQEPKVSAGGLSEPARQWRPGHRGRHGDQYPAAQSRRGHRRLLRLSRQPGDHDRRADGTRAGAGFPDRRHHHRPRRHPRRLQDRPRRGDAAGKTHVEEIRKDRDAIVFTEMPYQVNKAKLVERIAECVRDKMIEGISDLRDESDRDGVRVVVELKRDADARRRAEPALSLYRAADELSASTCWR